MYKMLLPALALVSAQAFANDGGITGVKVENLKIEKTTFHEGSEQTRAELPLGDDEEVEASFQGGNVDELMKLLPPVASVIRHTGRYQRSLALAAKEGYVSFTCTNATYTHNEANDTWSWVPHATKCTVTMKRYSEAISQKNMVTELFGDWNDLDVPRSCRMR